MVLAPIVTQKGLYRDKVESCVWNFTHIISIFPQLINKDEINVVIAFPPMKVKVIFSYHRRKSNMLSS